MGFCTTCGNKLGESHRFCGSCGGPVEPPKESGSPLPSDDLATGPNIGQSNAEPPLGLKHQARMLYDADVIDRKTLFDDGMLVLSPRDLILYTSDERDELRRIPVRTIQSCGYSAIRRCLLVKRRVNEEDNFQALLTQKRAELDDLKHKKTHYEDLLRQTRVLAERQAVKEKISKAEGHVCRVSDEIQQLESDPTKIERVRKKVADVQKEFFRLPKSFDAVSDKTAKEEYRIWAYVVNRRIKGVPKMKIETLPYDAVVTINDRVLGTTPLTVDKPIIDDAILEGEYRVRVLKEGRRHAELKITADLGKGPYVKKIELPPRDKTDYRFDNQVGRLRGDAPDRSIDLSLYEIDREVEGTNEVLLLASDGILCMSRNKEQCLFEIPYGSINSVKYDKGLFRGTKAVNVNYNERHFGGLEFDFWIDDRDGEISPSELRQRSESVVEILNKKRRESKVLDVPNKIRSPSYFTVTEMDIKNNFGRFEPFEFERLVAKLFERKGYKTTVTQERGDFGVDVIAEAGSDKIAIQVKHWQAPVGGPDVHKTVGSMITFGANRAMVVTSSDFTNQAYEIQKRGSPVELWNGSRLRDEFRQHLLDSINEARRIGA